MRKSIRIFAIGSLTLVLLFALTWSPVFSSSADPKNIRYLLWKAGFNVENLDDATEAMVGDTHTERLVVGLAKSQVREKFGYLLTPSEASPYLRNAYEQGDWKGEDVLFIRRSLWMVVFKRDTAVDLVLVKAF